MHVFVHIARGHTDQHHGPHVASRPQFVPPCSNALIGERRDTIRYIYKDLYSPNNTARASQLRTTHILEREMLASLYGFRNPYSSTVETGTK